MEENLETMDGEDVSNTNIDPSEKPSIQNSHRTSWDKGQVGEDVRGVGALAAIDDDNESLPSSPSSSSSALSNASTDSTSFNSRQAREENENRPPPFTCSLYISNYNETKRPEWLDRNAFKRAASQVVQGRMQIKETKCGLLVALSDPKDMKRVKELNIARIFRKPIQITSFMEYNCGNEHVALLLNVPWSLPLSEVEQALRKQGIKIVNISRLRTFIRVVIANAYGYERLLREGLNFYKSTCFKAITERMATEMYSENDSVIQCYRCQGFWHMASRCRNPPRCVRCGDRHALEYCTRPRTHPICCHCSGEHHAADPSCPVRKQLKYAVEMKLVLAKSKHTLSTVRSPSAPY